MTKNQKTGSKSPGVYLRRAEREDFEELARLYKISRTHLRGYAATHYDRARFDQMMSDGAGDACEYFLICTIEDGAIAGQINLSQIFRKSFQNAYLGYQLFSGFTGHGYMTEAVRLTVNFAFGQLGLHRLEANVQPTNLPSIKVLERSGFTKEGYSRRYLKIGGRWRDHERWAIIKEDWKKR
ncbi:MAG TPA: GNAT family protein [Pyrinomonadaceae bacterium]|nr:GNAT family protein [Pyrinomonadaceae bacterium]